jgi:hypothetical protein
MEPEPTSTAPGSSILMTLRNQLDNNHEIQGIHVVVEAGFGIKRSNPTYCNISVIDTMSSTVVNPRLFVSPLIEPGSLGRWRWHLVLPPSIEQLLATYPPPTDVQHSSVLASISHLAINTVNSITTMGHHNSDDHPEPLTTSCGLQQSPHGEAASPLTLSSSIGIDDFRPEYMLRVSVWERHALRSDHCFGYVDVPIMADPNRISLTRSQLTAAFSSRIDRKNPPPVFSVAHPLPLPPEAPYFTKSAPPENWSQLIAKMPKITINAVVDAPLSPRQSEPSEANSSMTHGVRDGNRGQRDNVVTITTSIASTTGGVGGMATSTASSSGTASSSSAIPSVITEELVPLVPSELPWVLATAYPTIMQPRCPYLHARSAMRPGSAVRIGILDIELIFDEVADKLLVGKDSHIKFTPDHGHAIATIRFADQVLSVPILPASRYVPHCDSTKDDTRTIVYAMACVWPTTVV